MEDRQHEPQVDRHGRLPRQERLDALLECEVTRVHLVVERDHLVRELGVALAERVHRAPERAEDELRLLLERRLERVQLLLERCPKRRVIRTVP